MAHPMPFAEILCHSKELAPLIERASQLAVLEEAFKRAVPPFLRDHCKVHRLEEETLNIVVRSPAVAGRVRQFEQRIAAQFQAINQPFKRIHLQVTPQSFELPPLPSTTPPRTIGPKGRAALAAWADSLPPSPLKDTVSRISALHPPLPLEEGDATPAASNS